MKEFLKGFLFRGLVACGGGPVVLAVIYGILGATGEVTELSPGEVSLGILSITVLAFFVAGMTAIYQMEKLPLSMAILLHGGALYAAYLVIYLLNGWMQRQLTPILVFTAVFLAGYGLVWLMIYLITKTKTQRLNELLKKE